jgi:periplasmic protein TonB
MKLAVTFAVSCGIHLGGWLALSATSLAQETVSCAPNTPTEFEFISSSSPVLPPTAKETPKPVRAEKIVSQRAAALFAERAPTKNEGSALGQEPSAPAERIETPAATAPDFMAEKPLESAPPQHNAASDYSDSQTTATTNPQGNAEVVDALVHERLRQAALLCYPKSAQRFGLRGECTLAFCVTGVGDVSDVNVINSSGHSSLDEAARLCVLKYSVPFPSNAAAHCFQSVVQFFP